MVRIRKVLAATAASALLATGAFAGAVGTHLVPTAAAQTTALERGGQIPEQAGLQVHKYLGLPGTDRGDGTAIEGGLGGDYEPIAGITFTAFPVTGIDLSELSGWQAADDLDINTLFTGEGNNSLSTVDPDQVGTGGTAITGPDGVADFGNLPTGLYLIVEEENPTAGNLAVAPAAPFLVTLPMTDPNERTQWLDVVHVYPKNQAAEAPVKTITDPVAEEAGVDVTGSSTGELIGYTIEGTVPQITPETGLNGFMITDRLPVGVGEPTDITVTLGTDTLTAVTDYDSYVYQLGDGAWVVRIELTEATLANLGAEDTPISLNFQARVEDASSGSLDNRAWILPSDPNLDGSLTWDPANPGDGPLPGTASNVVASKYGEVNITKVGRGEDGTENVLLPRAVFELRRCTAAGTLVENSAPIRVAGETEVTTDAEGTASISQIHLGNVVPQDGGISAYEDIWAGVGTQFCLLETQAPDGYELLPEPVTFELTADETTAGLVAADIEIENVEANAGFQLPLTGGMGIWLILGTGGLLLIAAAIYYAVIRQRGEA